MAAKIARLAVRPPFGLPEGAGGCRHIATVLHEGPNSANIHVSSGAIRGIPVVEEMKL